MRIIDATALKKNVEKWLPHDPCGYEENERPFETDICVSMLMEIDEAHTIDAVEVIRCGNCTNRVPYSGYCRLHKKSFDVDDYCSRGRRRDEDC